MAARHFYGTGFHSAASSFLGTPRGRHLYSLLPLGLRFRQFNIERFQGLLGFTQQQPQLVIIQWTSKQTSNQSGQRTL
jgi:hypothetical protein